MSHQDQKLAGLRTILVARCSEDGQIEVSIEKQLELGRAYAREHEMIVVDDVAIEGKSATLREHEPAMRALIERKRTHNDYDCVLILCMSRFDRQRAAGDHLFEEFERAGVLIVSEREGSFQGKWGWLFRNLYLQQAQAYVEELALHTTTGTMRALRQGHIPHTSRFPYGLDRQYRDVDGKVQFILRDVGGGQLQRINPATNEVTYLRRAKHLKFKHKLPEGSVTLVPGDRARLDVVCDIMSAHYRDGLGGMKIARSLNDKGMTGPGGGPWWKTSVEGIYDNPLYLGFAWCNTVTRATYVSRGTEQPIIYESPRQPGPKPDGNGWCLRVQTRKRPRAEWFRVEFPELRDILPPDLRELAEAAINAKLIAQDRVAATGLNAAGRRSGGIRHSERSYLLTGILKTLPGEHTMVGAGISKGDLRYRVGNASNRPCSGDPGLKLTISKTLIEKPVLDVLAEVMNTPGEFRDEIKDYVKQLVEEGGKRRNSLDVALEEKERVEAEYLSLMANLGPHGKQLAKDRIAQLERRLDHLAVQIEAAKTSTHAMSEADIDARVQAILRDMSDLGGALRAGTLAGRDLRQVLQTLIGRLALDANDRSLHLDVRLPKGMVLGQQKLIPAPGLVAGSGHQTGHQPLPREGCGLATYKCSYERKGRQACFKCRRQRKAA